MRLRARADLLPRRQVVWWVATAVIVLEILIFSTRAVPPHVSHWLLLNTRVLVMLGPPLAFASVDLLSLCVGTFGSLACMLLLRRALHCVNLAHTLALISVSVILWLTLGILAAASIV